MATDSKSYFGNEASKFITNLKKCKLKKITFDLSIKGDITIYHNKEIVGSIVKGNIFVPFRAFVVNRVGSVKTKLLGDYFDFIVSLEDKGEDLFYTIEALMKLKDENKSNLRMEIALHRQSAVSAKKASYNESVLRAFM